MFKPTYTRAVPASAKTRIVDGVTEVLIFHDGRMQWFPLSKGGRARIPKGATQELTDMIRGFDRQALHAVMLRLEHPVTGEMLEFHAPVPDHMIIMAEALRVDTKLNKKDKF